MSTFWGRQGVMLPDPFVVSPRPTGGGSARELIWGGWGAIEFGAGTRWDIQSVRGLASMPGVRSSDTARNQADGDWEGEDTEEGRTVTVELRRIACADAAQAVDELAEEWSSQPHEGPLLINGEWTVFCRPRTREIPQESERLGPLVSATLGWYQTDPRIYGPEQTGQAVLVSAEEYGRIYPPERQYPWMYEGSGRHSLILAENGGRRPSWRVWGDIYGPCLDPGLWHIQRQELLAFEIELAAGQVLHLDWWNGTVRLEQAGRYLTLSRESEWWPLDPHSSNPIRFVAGRFDREARLELRWRPAW